ALEFRIADHARLILVRQALTRQRRAQGTGIHSGKRLNAFAEFFKVEVQQDLAHVQEYEVYGRAAHSLFPSAQSTAACARACVGLIEGKFTLRGSNTRGI